MQNLKALLEKLINHNVDFVLVGGFAGVVHGMSMVTQDLDICAAITKSNLSSLRLALENLNPRHRMNPQFKPSFLETPKTPEEMKNIYLETDLGILDIMSSLPPIGNFELIKGRSIPIDLYGKTCHVIALEDLIAIKEVMKRPKDIQAVQELKLIHEKLRK